MGELLQKTNINLIPSGFVLPSGFIEQPSRTIQVPAGAETLKIAYTNRVYF
jgi:hypothetical protein